MFMRSATKTYCKNTNNFFINYSPNHIIYMVYLICETSRFLYDPLYSVMEVRT